MPSAQNPADIVSRGCNIDEIKSSMWFTGPEFLQKDASEWPKNLNFDLSPESLRLEKKRIVEAVYIIEKVQNRIIELIVTKSSVDKVIRIVAYIVRFIKNCKVQKAKRNKTVQTPVIDVEEREIAFLKIVQIIQADEFSDEIKELEKEKALKNNRIQKLNPFLQEYDVGFMNIKVLRVGERLSKSSLPYSAKHPLLMSKSSHFVQIYFRNLHLSNCHAGANLLLSMSREKIWIVNG